MRKIAVAHALPETFGQCLRDLADQHHCPPSEYIEIELTRFASDLRLHGWDVHVARHSMDLPDAVFAHDVVCPFYGRNARVGSNAILLLNMCHPQRKPEVDRWRNFYRQLLPANWDILRIQNPDASIEGGDIAETFPRRGLKMKRPAYFVGRSGRTNMAGVFELRKVADLFDVEVVEVEVDSECLHLETALTVLHGEVLLDPRWVDAAPFAARGFGIIEAVEPWSANVLHMPTFKGKGVIQASERFPKTISALRKRRYRVLPKVLSGIEYGQGGPSCLVRMLSIP